MNQLSVFIITYNEELLLPYTLDWYRKRFPGCPITVIDNFSTDSTVTIAISYGCKVLSYYSGDKMDDQALIDVKNECWKEATTPWVVIVDCDEWLDVWPKDLETDATIFRTSCVQMVGNTDNPLQMNQGVFYEEAHKFLCFNRIAIREMNYQHGCHNAFPFGNIRFSEKRLTWYHYKWLNVDYVIKRHRHFRERLSDQNKRLNLSYHYSFSERNIRKEYKKLLKSAKKVTFRHE